MKKFPLLLMLLLAVSFAGCTTQLPPEITEPTSMPTTVPTVEPTTAPTTEPVPPTTEPAPLSTTEPDEPRQEGHRLSTEELASYNLLFAIQTDRYARHPINYYNQALAFEFADPREIPFGGFFSWGFNLERNQPITEEERSHFAKAHGYEEYGYDIYRLPAEKVNEILVYHFGITFDQMYEDSGYNPVYSEDTDCYYIDPPGVVGHGYVTFYDGYFDEGSGIVYLYYENRNAEQEFVVVMQSRKSSGEQGYNILSNLPTERQ